MWKLIIVQTCGLSFSYVIKLEKLWVIWGIRNLNKMFVMRLDKDYVLELICIYLEWKGIWFFVVDEKND